MDPEMVQARYTLVEYLFRETMLGLTQALELSRQPPLKPEEKEIIFGEVERAVWAFPDGFFRDAPSRDEGWAARAADDAGVRAALERGVRRVLEDRKRS